LNECLDAALDNVQAALAEAEATVTRDPLPEVLGNANQLTQVFQNLISNSIKYASPGRKPLVQVTREPDEEGKCVIAVADNGQGFDQEFARLIFEPFKRLQGRVPGSGIGLAICRRIVESHEGHIWAESSEGQGAAFRFTLPLWRPN